MKLDLERAYERARGGHGLSYSLAGLFRRPGSPGPEMLIKGARFVVDLLVILLKVTVLTTIFIKGMLPLVGYQTTTTFILLLILLSLRGLKK